MLLALWLIRKSACYSPVGSLPYIVWRDRSAAVLLSYLEPKLMCGLRTNSRLVPLSNWESVLIFSSLAFSFLIFFLSSLMTVENNPASCSLSQYFTGFASLKAHATLSTNQMTNLTNRTLVTHFFLRFKSQRIFTLSSHWLPMKFSFIPIGLFDNLVLAFRLSALVMQCNLSYPWFCKHSLISSSMSIIFSILKAVVIK